MISENLTAYLLSKGYVQEDKRLMGYYYQYPITATLNSNGKKEWAIIIMSLANRPPKDVIKAAKKEIGIRLNFCNAQSTRHDLITIEVRSADGDMIGAWEDTLSSNVLSES